jgi:hypothetical protein
MEQVLTPGVEHREKANLRTQVLGISGDGEQGFRRCLEQDAIQLSLVLIGDGGNLLGYGEDHVEVLGVQKLGLASFEPLSPGKRLAFWAMAIAAGVVSVALMAAVVTLLQMATENSSPADLDRSHDTALRHRQRSAMLLTIDFAVAAKHIRHLKLGTIHVPELEVLWWSGLGLSNNRLREQIEGTGSGAHFAGRDA